MTHPLDELAPPLAKWLAPYLAAELGLTAPSTSPTLSATYDEHTAEVFASGLGDVVLPRASHFFGALWAMTDGDEEELHPDSITSLQLAKLLKVDSPRNIASVLTNSLKRRAKNLGLPRPWLEDETAEGRTVWRCRDPEEAHRLFEAVGAEQKKRA